MKGDHPSLNEKSVIDIEIGILHHGLMAESLSRTEKRVTIVCMHTFPSASFSLSPPFLAFIDPSLSLLKVSSFLLYSFGCVFKCVHVWRGWISRSRRGPSWIRPQIYHWVLFIEASMVPFEYEKKEPSEWFRRGASPGRNISVYGVSLKKHALIILLMLALKTQAIYCTNNIIFKQQRLILLHQRSTI